jgi:hypothetical protein
VAEALETLSAEVGKTYPNAMPWDLIILMVSLFAFIVSMILALKSFFERRWGWFFPLVVCVLVTSTVLFLELEGFIMPPPPRDLPVVVRNPMTPL